MRSYETTFILAPTLDAEGLAREIEAIKKVIGAQGGEITAEKEWGRRRLAYPLRDHSEGVYHILRFSLADRGGLKELARRTRTTYAGQLAIGEDLMRIDVGDTPRVLPRQKARR